MKYKEQALNKIEKIEHQIRALEVGINRGHDLSEVVTAVNSIKEAVEDLRSTISIENDEWN